jgi:predicted NBD/HSP70 family sugar kinase
VPIAVRSSAGSTPADQATVRRLNLSLLLRNLAVGGARSRARLAQDTGLTKATVSSLVAELIERSLVVEGTVERSGLGRPGRAVELDPDGVRFLGIELQVDDISGMVLDLPGRVLARQRLSRSMAELGPARALGEVADLARSLVAEAGSRVDQVQSLHLAVPGLIDADAGMLALAPNLHWRDVDIVHTLMGRLQWNDARIGVDNDANMGAMAHYATSDSSGSQNLLYLAGAVGVGAGMIVDGRIVRGAAGFAGEVGHIALGSPDRQCGCGRRGCWETAVSLSALLDAVCGDAISKHPADLRAELVRMRSPSRPTGWASACPCCPTSSTPTPSCWAVISRCCASTSASRYWPSCARGCWPGRSAGSSSPNWNSTPPRWGPRTWASPS